MDDATSSNSNAIFGKGPWIRKKRYEEEDYSFSPPSDDSGFLPLKLGLHQTKTDDLSMYDRINQHLGFTEVSKPPTHNNSFGEGDSLTGSLFIGSNKINLETQDSFYHPIEQQITSPFIEEGCLTSKIFIPPTIAERRESQADCSSIAGFEDRPEFSRVAREDAATLVSKARSGRPTRKISMNLEDTVNRRALLESFQAFSINPAESLLSVNTEEEGTTSPSHKANIPFLEDKITLPILPLIEDKLVIPPSFQERRRKISAPPNLNPMTMEKSSNYFFTGGIFSNLHPHTAPISEATTSSHLTSSLSQFQPDSQSRPLTHLDQPSLSTATQMTDDRSSESLVVEPKTKMGKRRPKPSALREMNFWAPQSM